MTLSTERIDVLIVGAGISGIGAAYYVQSRCPKRSFAILEGRAAIGGTWDLFRYPGIRSDSDMFTLGYAFHPWTQGEAIADGEAILAYLNETVDAYDLRRHIRFQKRVVDASWSTEDACWTVSGRCGDTGQPFVIQCNFLFMCSGYYNYERGHRPTFAGQEDFSGPIVHPQHWPEDLDCAGKKIVVIGSGATAVTLVPALTEADAQVTMLQRSPTYVWARPSQDHFANWLRARVSSTAAYGLTRWKNVFLGSFFFTLSRRAPSFVRRQIRKAQREALGPDFDIDTHFTPRYQPWDQRFCLAPDGDFFIALREGKADIVTDTIQTFTSSGIRLDSGRELEADIIVTATGLELLFLAGMSVTVDGQRRDLSESRTYKAMMFSDIPNLALSFGYTNASWTLKSDLTGEYVCRLLNHMERRGYRTCTPRCTDPTVTDVPFLDFTSGYIQRALPNMPKQGSRAPWRLNQDYLLDLVSLRYGRVDDPEMDFS